ncbi:MAG: hypothetical protein JKX69_16055 [Rhodobacteraceae bacterium]|nr:hypothetical protein [Paracoccaceae bacterium]
MYDPQTDDHKGVIGESYKIDGISAGECRSIFLDWALSLPNGAEPKEAIARLLAHYGQAGHPMTDVLRAGLTDIATPARRGGRGARRS